MVKVQIELNEENKRFLKMFQIKNNLKTKSDAINLMINKYSFGWIGYPYMGMNRTLLETIINKITYNENWIEFKRNNSEKEFWNKVKEVFDIDEIQINELKKEK